MTTKAAAIHQRVVKLCRENSDSRALRAAVLEEVRRLVAFEAYAWLLTDPETCVGSAPLAHVPDIARLPQLIRLKYATTVNRWTTLKPNTCVTLAEATAGDLSRSLLWKDLMSGYGVTDVASMVFRDQFAPIPAAAYNVAAQLMAVEDNAGDGPPEARAQPAGAEWINLRAARLGGAAPPGAGTIAVTIEPITAQARLELYGRAAGLTPRERELLHQLARGTSTRQLARDMRLSPHTVQDHLKSVFRKTDTGSRSSLLARALGTEAG